ncbi:MAG TPA: OmpA family protein [Persephonella sp.]|uniref:OmpA/MotB n=1 Tax=Persephonella marina (strain DSM 14350 / EX-H1) TaxID=123214 RepID=C0QT83_PERMH|nr:MULTISPECIES: OmpA family protein [Persephonella]ACO04567.1 OmpA/MotB [Persephonella marina EX-H1]HCB70483.1 OmpA family protein [Persephonella sp.]
MKKKTAFISAVIGVSLIFGSCAKKTEEVKKPWEKETEIKLSSIKDKINQLYKLHVVECAPKDIAIAESYIDAVDGLEYIDPNENVEKTVHISKVDQITYLNKARKYVSIARNKVYSDVDKDGIPCYQEIEQGTDPFVPEGEKVAKLEERKTPEKKVEKEREIIEEQFEGYYPLKLHARIHFEFDKYQIKKEYLPYLNVISKYLKSKPNLKVKIVGYTDSIGSKSYNDRLAYKRALAVKEYLIKQGIPAERIEIVGRGKENYLVDNKTWLNRFTNRRADFFVMEVTQ